MTKNTFSLQKSNASCTALFVFDGIGTVVGMERQHNIDLVECALDY